MSRSQRNSRRFVPNLENLENRCCPATTMGLADHGHTLVLLGDGSANHISIVQNARGVQVVADDVERNLTPDSGHLRVAVAGDADSDHLSLLVTGLQNGRDNVFFIIIGGRGEDFALVSALVTVRSCEHVSIVDGLPM